MSVYSDTLATGKHELIHGSLGLNGSSVLLEIDESVKYLGLAVLVNRNERRCDFSKLSEQSFEVLFGGALVNVVHKQVGIKLLGFTFFL